MDFVRSIKINKILIILCFAIDLAGSRTRKITYSGEEKRGFLLFNPINPKEQIFNQQKGHCLCHHHFAGTYWIIDMIQ